MRAKVRWIALVAVALGGCKGASVPEPEPDSSSPERAVVSYLEWRREVLASFEVEEIEKSCEAQISTLREHLNVFRGAERERVDQELARLENTLSALNHLPDPRERITFEVLATEDERPTPAPTGTAPAGTPAPEGQPQTATSPATTGAPAAGSTTRRVRVKIAALRWNYDYWAREEVEQTFSVTQQGGRWRLQPGSSELTLLRGLHAAADGRRAIAVTADHSSAESIARTAMDLRMARDRRRPDEEFLEASEALQNGVRQWVQSESDPASLGQRASFIREHRQELESYELSVVNVAMRPDGVREIAVEASYREWNFAEGRYTLVSRQDRRVFVCNVIDEQWYVIDVTAASPAAAPSEQPARD